MTALPLLCAGAAPATAAIGSGNLASLFLEAYDTGASGKTYIRDLGVPLVDFGTGNRPGGGFSTVVDQSAGASRNWNLTLDNAGTATDGNWSSFIGSVSGASNIRWDVVAVDNAGSNNADQKRVLFSSLTNAQSAIAPGGVQQANSGFNAIFDVDIHILDANDALGGGISAIANPGDDASFLSFRGSNLNGGLASALGATTAALGQVMGFYYMTRSGAFNSDEAAVAAYGNGGGAATWTLNAAGSLVYSVPVPPVPVVPEPGTWLLFGCGLLLALARSAYRALRDGAAMRFMRVRWSLRLMRLGAYGLQNRARHSESPVRLRTYRWVCPGVQCNGS